MAQTEFVQRNDGKWYAPPIDPSEVLDYTVKFAGTIGTDTIEDYTVTATDITVALHAADARDVTVWLKDGVLKKTASVTIHIRTVGGRHVERTFRIEVADQ